MGHGRADAGTDIDSVTVRLSTGAPTITGTAQVGQTLTAVTTGITDAEGLTSSAYTYQWIRVNGTAADIAGENSSTYTLVDADLGKAIKVKVSFTDDASNAETRTSAATATVTATADPTTQTTVWSATLTPATLGGGSIGCTSGGGAPASRLCSNTAVLSEDEFTHDSTNYTVTQLFLQSNGAFQFNVDTALTTATAALTLVVAGTSLDPADAIVDASFGEIAWSSSATSVSLTAGTAVSVSLVSGTGTVSTNNAAMGAPTITGTAQVGQTLTAVTTGITDADGLTSPTYTYQWIRVNGTDAGIAGANSSTYTLRSADLGKTIKVRVSFTDDAGNAETLTSAATATVTADPNNAAPTVATVIQDRTATVGTALSYAFPADTFADTDAGDTLTYTATKSDDSALPPWLSFDAATRTFSGTPQAADVGTVSVKVTASDGNGGSVSDTFDIVVSAAANTAAMGAPTITGTAQVGKRLTAVTTGITDANGLTSVTYTYQWIRVDGGTEADITGANSSTYDLVAADQGKTIKVRVSFTDDGGNAETLTSAATATVTPVTPTLQLAEGIGGGASLVAPGRALAGKFVLHCYVSGAHDRHGLRYGRCGGSDRRGGQFRRGVECGERRQ